jgi:Domain of unknown function (DUF4193)
MGTPAGRPDHTEGSAAFESRSRRPQHHPHAVPAEVEDTIVRLRKTLVKPATTPARPPSDLDGDACTLRLNSVRTERDPRPGKPWHTMCCRSHSRQTEYGHETGGICVRSCYKVLLSPLKGDKTMSTDYDAPRRTETDDVSEDSLEELTAGRSKAQLAVVDVDESESAESFELPGADLSGEELSVRVIPKQANEFTCSSCFLVHHRSRLASEKDGIMICTDCVA